MSTFGSPGGAQSFSRPVPPERGSFPLDHDGDCKTYMTKYLTCIKQAKGVNQNDCRMLSKDYLKCRMEHNLMARDEMKNLGYADPLPTAPEPDDSLETLARKSRGP